ncbi:class I adenylate-forming enzyme family protein [Amycolatopsis anabasis]|uniref:class I adenylate-forming enzyme family protein n=1 Tax=Amycolatopsis anabasis TaxID=1840409 RepID=UPI001FEABF78|nr:class I adenylate-forming enzyme family protein [Amycolatopsis anabasis]
MSAEMRELLDGLFEAHPGESPYLAHGDHVLTRAQLRDAVAEESVVFAGHGVGAGSTVLLQVPPSYTQVETLFALWRLGAQVMLVDHRLKPSEVDTLRMLCRPQFLVRGGVAGRSALGFQAGYELVTARCGDGLPAATGHRLVQFSSGSTGLPKVIGRTAGSLAAEVDRFAHIEGMPGPGERVLLLSSTVHSFGLIAGLLHSLARGVTAVFTRRISAADMLSAATRHEVHAVFGTPFHYELLSTARELPPLPALRAAVSGGEIMPPETAARFAERFGVGVGESYGTTETGVIAMEVSGASRPSVGKAAPGIRLRIRHGELDVELPEGSPYLRSPGEDRYVDGWLRTHDRAEVDASGGVRLLGRGDSLVVIGGLKLDLTEVEAVLREHPLVAEAVVVHAGVTEAYVRANASPAELLSWCRDRLADYKVPRVIQVLPELPRTSNGKLVRRRDALLAVSPNP